MLLFVFALRILLLRPPSPLQEHEFAKITLDTPELPSMP